MVRCKYLKTSAAAEQAVTSILTHEKPVIGVKCFGVNLTNKGCRLTLVAISTWDGDAYAFDVQKCPAIMYDGGLLRMLQSVDLLKVFHDCGPDSAALFRQFGVSIKNFFDTQIANSVLMETNGLSPRRVTFHSMCRDRNIDFPMPSQELQQLLVEDPNVWARRPCTKEMLELATSHVTPLVPGLYQELNSALPESSDEWFSHLCEENRLSLISNKRPGTRSKTKCPPNRAPTKSLHLVPDALPETSDEWFSHLCEENRLSLISYKRPGTRSKTKCPPNRAPTKSLHLVPEYNKMHFCV